MLLPIRLVRTLVCNCTPPSDTPPYAGPFDFSFFFFFFFFFFTSIFLLIFLSMVWMILTILSCLQCMSYNRIEYLLQSFSLFFL